MTPELRCSGLVLVAEHIRGTNPITNDSKSFAEAVEVAQCCRKQKRFDLAGEVLSMLEERSIPDSVKKIVKQERELCFREVSEDEPERTLPPIMVMGWNFAKAMASHAASGFKRCTKKEIHKRLAICQQCPLLVDSRCTHQHCGCRINDQEVLLNKLALKSETCPESKW